MNRVPCFIDEEFAKRIFKIGKLIWLLKKIDINFVSTEIWSIDISDIIQEEKKNHLKSRLELFY